MGRQSPLGHRRNEFSLWTSLNPGDEAACLGITQMRILHARVLEDVLEYDLEGRRPDTSLDEHHPFSAVALERQWQPAECLRQVRAIVALARGAMDKHRPRRRQGGRVGERLIGEQQPLLSPSLKGLQTETARAVSACQFDVGRMAVLG